MRVSDTSTIEPPAAIHAGFSALSELTETINGLTEVPTLARIKDWFSSLDLRRRDYDRHRLFTPRKYARNLIARSEFAELLMELAKKVQGSRAAYTKIG